MGFKFNPITGSLDLVGGGGSSTPAKLQQSVLAADVMAPPSALTWTPASLTGVGGWYGTESGVTAAGSAISGWTDQSGAGNHLTGLNSPTLVSPDSTLATAQKSITFNGTNQEFTATNHAALNPGTGDFYAAIMVKFSDTTTRMIIGKDSYAGGPYTGWFLQWIGSRVRFTSRNSAAGLNYSFDSSITLSLNTWYRLVATRVGRVLTLYIDGTARGTVTEGSAVDVDNAAAFRVGRGDTSATPLAGSVSFALFGKATLSGGDRGSLESYMSQRYTTGVAATGDRYLLGFSTATALASGAWAGHDGHIAEFEGSGWEFTVPFAGMSTINQEDRRLYEYAGTTWQALGTLGAP